MPQLVTESIWHFAGYLHLTQLLADTPTHYSGAPVYKFASFTPETPGKAPAPFKVSFSYESTPLDIKVPVAQPASAHQQIGSSAAPAKPVLGSLHLLPDAEEITEAPPIPRGGGDYGVASTPWIEDLADLQIRVTYTVGATHMSVFSAQQINFMFDLDALVGAEGYILPKDSEQIVERMISSAEKLIPSDAFPEVAPDGISLAPQGLTAGASPFSIDVSGRHSIETLEVEGTSRYVNGMRVDDPDEPATASDAVTAQLNSIGERVEAFNARFEEDEDTVAPDNGDEDTTQDSDLGQGGATAEGGHVHVETTTTPTGGYAQETTTGTNAALNVAMIDDRVDAVASLVIKGDLHETNAIIQINVLADKDTVRASGSDVARAVVEHANGMTNAATFVDDPGIVFGDGESGFSGAYNWHVTYVDGDYWNIATFSQTNVLLDGDLSEQFSTTANFQATLGANGQLNFGELGLESLQYDLIIIGGNYYDYNTILQLNLIYDVDVVKQLLGGEGTQAIVAGSNRLTNEATIANLGSEDFKPITDDVDALVNAIAQKQEILDPEDTLGIPGNGTGMLNALYVSGNYYDFDLIYQTNVIADGDKVAQQAPGGAPAANEEFAQSATAGGNEATNLALIIDVDSLTGYQYLGGEVYEDTMLVQANLVRGESEEDALSGSDLHPDVVAAIAAMNDDADHNTIDSIDDAGSTNAGVDVLGSMMT